MKRDQALAILGLTPTSTAAELSPRYEEIYSDLQVRLTNAPTSALKMTYRRRLVQLQDAYDSLLDETASIDADLPTATPARHQSGKMPALPGSNSAVADVGRTRQPMPPWWVFAASGLLVLLAISIVGMRIFRERLPTVASSLEVESVPPTSAGAADKFTFPAEPRPLPLPLHSHGRRNSFALLEVQGFLYVPHRHEALLHVLDVTTPERPDLVGTHEILLGENPFVEGNRLYGQTSIVDVSDPRSPRLLDDCGTYGGRWIGASGTRMYGGGQGSHIVSAFDGDDPTNCVLLGRYQLQRNLSGYNFSFGPRDVEIQGNTLYVVDTLHARSRGSELRVVSFSDPSSPRLVGAYPHLNWPSGLDVVAGRVFVATDDGLQIIDTRGRRFVREAGCCPIPPMDPARWDDGWSDYWLLSVIEDKAFVSISIKKENYLQVIDVRDPKQPVWIDTWHFGSKPATDVAIVQGRLFAANVDGVYLLSQ